MRSTKFSGFKGDLAKFDISACNDRGSSARRYWGSEWGYRGSG